MTDELMTTPSFAGKHNQHVRASRELLAMGAANAAAGFTQGFSVGAAGSRTAVKDSHGVRTQISGVFRGRDDRLHPAFPDRAGAVGLSVVDPVRRSARPYDALLGFVDTLGRSADVSLHPSARITPGVVVYRLDDPVFLAHAKFARRPGARGRAARPP